MMQYYRSHGDSAAGLGHNGILALPATLELSTMVQVEPDPHLVPADATEADDDDEEESAVDTP